MPDKTALESEFGFYSDWIVSAAEQLQTPERIAVASRGTGNPALLRMVADAAGIGPRAMVLDVGCGLGGPAAWLAGNTGCTVVGFDLMEEAVRGRRRLFPDARSVVASSDALPFHSGSFDAACCLGVLQMVDGKAAALMQIARVLRPGGRFCLYEWYSREEPRPSERPATDHFISARVMERLILESGLDLLRAQRTPPVAEAPPRWSRVTRMVREEIARTHAGDPHLREAESRRRRFLEMKRAGDIEDWVFVTRKAG